VAGPRFSILPIEALKDTRLTPRDLRVLIALHAFKDQAGRCWPSRGLLAALTGLPEARISVATSRLESVTVTDPVTVTKPVTKTVTDSVTKTVTETVRGIEQTMNIPENKPLSCADGEGEYQVEQVRRKEPGAKALAVSFERFWAAYPKKRNKGDAMKAWRALKPSEELVTAILAAVERAKASVQWRKDEGQFIPYPASWLRARGFEDEEHVDVVPLPHTRGEKGRIASSVAALQTLFGANDGKANDGKADLPAGNGVPRRRLRG
jgi:hypothetical protein